MHAQIAVCDRLNESVDTVTVWCTSGKTVFGKIIWHSFSANFRFVISLTPGRQGGDAEYVISVNTLQIKFMAVFCAQLDAREHLW